MHSKILFNCLWLLVCAAAYAQDLPERSNYATMKGTPITLVGMERKVGDVAPDVTLLKGMSPYKLLSEAAGKIVVISAVPSLDTPVCELQTKTFNDEIKKLSDNKIQLITVSMDLPFAQARFCGAHDPKLFVLSDHKDGAFGKAYGVLIKERRLLARSVFVVDVQGKIAYTEYLTEMAKQPNYEEALQAVKQLLSNMSNK